MTPFALSGICILTTCMSAGIFVLIKAPNNSSNRLWGYFNFIISLWGLAVYNIGSTLNPKIALLWIKIGLVSVIAIPIVFLQFVSSFLEEKNKIIIIIAHIIGFLFLLTLLTNQLAPQYKFIFNSFYFTSQPTIIYSFFLFFWALTVS